MSGSLGKMKGSGRGTHVLTRRFQEDRGNAVVEFVGLAVVLLIPLVYLVLTLGLLQAATFAADTAARQAARIAATEPDEARRAERLEHLTSSLGGDYGVPLGQDSVSLTCTRSPCALAGGEVRADVAIDVPLPGLGFVGIDSSGITATASHVQRADEHVEGAVP